MRLSSSVPEQDDCVSDLVNCLLTKFLRVNVLLTSRINWRVEGTANEKGTTDPRFLGLAAWRRIRRRRIERLRASKTENQKALAQAGAFYFSARWARSPGASPVFALAK